jgi:hypothetical protein
MKRFPMLTPARLIIHASHADCVERRLCSGLKKEKRSPSAQGGLNILISFFPEAK